MSENDIENKLRRIAFEILEEHPEQRVGGPDPDGLDQEVVVTRHGASPSRAHTPSCRHSLDPT